MSNSVGNWRIVSSPDGGFELQNLDNAECTEQPELKMEYEGGKVKEPEPDAPPYACRIGFHEWQWYEGLMDRYWFCKICDHKDKTKQPPKAKR